VGAGKKNIEKYFNMAFWIENGNYLADYVGHEGQNKCVRPNQLFTCSFEFSPLSDEQNRWFFRRLSRSCLQTGESEHSRRKVRSTRVNTTEMSFPETVHIIRGQQGHGCLVFTLMQTLNSTAEAFINKARDLLSALRKILKYTA
jgi:hypothetical protein